MKTWSLQSNALLAGLTRGIWLAPAAGLRQDRRDARVDAARRPGPPGSDTEMPDRTREDRTTGPASSTSERS